MRSALVVLSLFLTGAAAVAALVVVLPAPTKSVAFAAIVVGEKTFLVVVAALLGGLLAYLNTGPGHRVGPGVALVLATFAAGIGLLLPAQAVLLAHEREVRLDLMRYLTAPIDIGKPHPARTVPFGSVEGKPLAMDVYPPARTDGPAPAVIVIHGGGWSSGDKGETPLANERLAAAGYAVFDVQYRLEPAGSWKGAVGDIKCAVGWVKEHARQEGVDPARVTLLGRSAGGHLALLAAYAADLPASCRIGDAAVESVIAFYAPTDLGWGHRHPANPSVYDSTFRLERFLGGSPQEVPDAYRQASITTRVTPRVPRTLLVHGGRDQFVSPSNLYLLAPQLAAAGANHDTLVIPYGQHGFDYVVGGLSGQIAEAVVLHFLAASGRK
jgi:acetyl esterase/lipase